MNANPQLEAVAPARGGEVRARRVVKRYVNRKFYDTATSRYVNLAEIGAMVAAGIDVQIVENGTGRDLTVAVLGHVLVGARPGAPAVVDAGALTQLIRGGGRVAPAEDAQAAALSAAEERLDDLLGQAHREAAAARERARATEAALEALRRRIDARADATCEVASSFARLKRELSRIGWRVDALHEQLRRLEDLPGRDRLEA